MRIMVTGSRYWTDVAGLDLALAAEAGAIPPADLTLIHGDAQGADRAAARYAEGLGWNVQAYPPDPPGYGPQLTARNQAMIDSEPDVVLAFPLPGSVGTWDTVNRAKRAGITVRRIKPSA
jgi:hypothetical protein